MTVLRENLKVARNGRKPVLVGGHHSQVLFFLYTYMYFMASKNGARQIKVFTLFYTNQIWTRIFAIDKHQIYILEIRFLLLIGSNCCPATGAAREQKCASKLIFAHHVRHG